MYTVLYIYIRCIIYMIFLYAHPRYYLQYASNSHEHILGILFMCIGFCYVSTKTLHIGKVYVCKCRQNYAGNVGSPTLYTTMYLKECYVVNNRLSVHVYTLCYCFCVCYRGATQSTRKGVFQCDIYMCIICTGKI